MNVPAQIQANTCRPDDLDAGEGLMLFTSGSAPAGADMCAGEGLEMFTTSCLGEGSSMLTGARTGLFTTSC